MADSLLTASAMTASLTLPNSITAAPRAAAPWSLPWPRLLPALATALLLALCHFTILPILCGWLAWFALVPMLCLVRSEARPRRIYSAAWAGGLAFFTFVLQWMRVADWRMYFTWAMLAVWCSLYVPLGIFLIRKLDRRTRWPLVLTVPVVWTGLELVRAHLLTGFAWYFLGHTQHDFLSVIQIADLGGAYAVTFIVAMLNALLFELLFVRLGFRRVFALPALIEPRRPGLALQALTVALLLAGTLGYGYWRLNQDAMHSGPRVALVQGNVPQAVKNSVYDADEQSDRQVAADTLVHEYLGLHDIAERGKPALIVWPETSYPADWYEFTPEFLKANLEYARRHPPPEWKGVPFPSLDQWGQLWSNHENKNLLREAMSWPTNVLLGLTSEVNQLERPAKRFNSAVYFHPGAKFGGRYDKIHRVPWGEYVPLRDWIPAMDFFAPYDHDYTVAPGEQLTRFELGDYRFGVLICFEDSDPYLARQFLRRPHEPTPLDVLPQIVGGGMYAHLPPEPPSAKPVDFLVNISNDGWFEGTSEHEEHLAVCRFRAVECRRSVVRAVNMGVSAVIDGNGRVLAPTETERVADKYSVWEINQADGLTSLPPSRWKEFKKVAGVLTADVPLDTRSSFYARWGDWLPASCWLIIGLGLVLPFRRRI